MVDREKVIKGLECCILHDPDDHYRCAECPYNTHDISNAPCANSLKRNALELLKEHEAVKPIFIQTTRIHEGGLMEV